jgi:hypothetical protein
MMLKRAWWMIVALALGMVAYYLPWFTHKTAGFTMNAFDLAEWTSLHPAVRSESPAMLTSFLLRAPQVALVMALAIAASRLDDPRSRWIMRAMAMLLALRFVPPTDFLGSAQDDPNYRQMALMTVIGLASVVAVVPLHRTVRRWHDVLLGGVLLIGTAAGWWGLSRAKTLLDNFEIGVSTGPGVILFSVITVIVLGALLWSARLRLRQGEPIHPAYHGA